MQTLNVIAETENFQLTTSGKWLELRLNDGVENTTIMMFNRNTPYLHSFITSAFDDLKDELDELLSDLTKEND